MLKEDYLKLMDIVSIAIEGKIGVFDTITILKDRIIEAIIFKIKAN